MDFREGGQRLYAMIGPDNEEHWGITIYKQITHHKHFSGEDAFSDKNGKIDSQLSVAKFENYFKIYQGNYCN